jgi:hypothetical protein
MLLSEFWQQFWFLVKNTIKEKKDGGVGGGGGGVVVNYNFLQRILRVQNSYYYG